VTSASSSLLRAGIVLAVVMIWLGLSFGLN